MNKASKNFPNNQGIAGNTIEAMSEHNSAKYWLKFSLYYNRLELMKHISVILFLTIFTFSAHCQNVIPSPLSPCENLDTNTIKNLIIGTWVDIKDSTHILIVTYDSVEETVVIQLDGKSSSNQSYWNYRFTDNIFSSDAVTCYSLVEYKPDFNRNTKVAINYIDAHYMLMGAEGKMVFKRRK